MLKRFILGAGIMGAMSSIAFAATATVWTEEGPGTKAPAYWYSYEYGTGSSVDTSTTASNVKVAEFAVSSGKASNGAGFGFAWEQNAAYKDVAVSLASYKGVCLTYRSTAPFRIDFKQSTITDDNYYGSELSAGAKKTYIAFSSLKQGWKSTSTVAWNATKQLGVQFSYKNNHATSTVNTNTVEIVSFILADECVTYAPELQDPYKSQEDPVETLVEGDTLSYDLSALFSDPDGDDLDYSVKIVDEEGNVKLADSLYAKTNIVSFVTKSNPVGSATVTITATDPSNKSASYKVTVETVDRENAPVAVDDSYSTNEETKLVVTLKNNVLANDYDPDGDGFVPELVSSTEHGVLVFDEEIGGFTYTPEKDFFGTDAFTYRLVESARADASYEVKASEPATVTITVKNVNDPLVATVSDSLFTAGSDEYRLGDTISVEEDFDAFIVKIPTANVDFNDPDFLASKVAANVKASGVVNVEYNLIGTNHVIEIAPVADANGVSKVTLYAADGKDTASVWFYVKVLPVADPPVAVEDSYKVVQDSANKVDAKKGLLVNDKNPDGKSALKAYLYDGAIEGSVTLAEDGSFVYKAGHFEGEDTFMYYVVNAEGDTSEPVVVTLTVEYKNLPPQILEGVADTVGKRLATLTEDFTSAKKFTKVEIQSWFADDADDVTKLTFSARSDDSLLVTTLNATGLFVGSVKNACGDATVILTATDTKGASTDLLIPAKIACTNDKPVAAKVQDTIYIGVGAWKDTINLYNYVKDPDGDSLTFTVTSNKVIDQKFDWKQDGYKLVISTKDSAGYLEKGSRVSFAVKAADSLTYVTFNLVLLAENAPTSIKPEMALPRATWQTAILESRGAVMMFDMQGRVMWKSKLPVSEADVRSAAARTQGRKILQVNRQRWTIK